MKVFALLVSLAIPASAQEIVRAIELPRATLSELAAIPLREQPRVIEQRWLPPIATTIDLQNLGAVPELDVPHATVAAPPAVTFFAETSAALSPADASGAVGPNHLVSACNSAIVVQNRSGAILRRTTLEQFWFSNAQLGTHYDPRVIYDAKYDRWVIESIFDEKAVMLAVSETGDPTGAWRRYQFADPRADYSQLVIAGESIVAGTTDYAFQKSHYFLVSRTTAYANPVTLEATRFDPSAYNATPAWSETQKWLLVSNSLNLAWISFAAPTQWFAANSPGTFNIPTGAPLPQASGPGLDGGFGMVESAVEHGGWIYTITDRLPRGTSRRVLEWCRFHPVTRQATWGTIVDPDPSVSYAYPSLAVNRNGAMAIGFGIFSASTYPSSGFVYCDPAGNCSATTRIRRGDAPFIITDRWGDYTSTVVDPADNTTFWTLQMHATGGHWETTWTRIGSDAKSKRRTARH